MTAESRGVLVAGYARVLRRRASDHARPRTLCVKRSRITIMLRRDTPIATALAMRAAGAVVAIADE